MNVLTLLASSEPVTLTNCDREPIRTPEAIQPDGVLIAALVENGRVTHVSANAGELFGEEPLAFLGRTLADVLGPDAARKIYDSVHGERSAPAQVISLDGSMLTGGQCFARAHLSDDRVVVEIEPDRSGGEAGLPLARVDSVMQALRGAASFQHLLDAAARELKLLTGYDRVMVYRFDEEGNGQVLAEAREPDQEAFLHLRYPASDIPPQARRLYLQQRVRVIGDVNYVPVPVLASPKEAVQPLDMTYCALRSISPMHIQYLRNMGVGATLGISLVQDNLLWGLVVCHHRKAFLPTPQMRSFCDLIGQVLSLLISAKTEAEASAERAAREALLRTISDRLLTEDTVREGLFASDEQVLGLTQADGALLRVGGQTRLLGQTPPLADALRIMSTLRKDAAEDLMSVEALGAVRPEFARLAEAASGALFLPLLNNPGDGILWFRKELVRTVEWGGDPNKSVQLDPLTGELSPRRSFAAWKQLLTGHSTPWGQLDLELARGLRRTTSRAILRQVESRLTHVAEHDKLTGLLNRSALEERLGRPEADQGDSSLIFIDIDRFKAVNDSMGHSAGDELLKQVAWRLETTVARSQILARLGGDEFVVLCEATSVQGAVELATGLEAAFQEPFLIEDRQFHATASFGVASSDDLGREEMLRAAHMAMYAAKRSGGNKVVLYQEGLHSGLRRRIEIEQELFGALERDELRLVYQPVMQVPDMNLLGFEALLRWEHPRLGAVSPVEFVPVAEETGLILPIGEWVVAEALNEVRRWRERGVGIYVSVNASGHQIASPGFARCVAEAVNATGVPPQALVLEVTESVLMKEEAVRVLEQVRAGGVRIAIDDFGTGYSSLGYLRRLPVDLLKIDRSLLADVDLNPSVAAFFGSLVRMAHALRLKVIVEGVETLAQWHYLRALDADAAQGYWLSRPLEAGALEAWMTRPAS